MRLNRYLIESIHDVGLFKSCFMAGNPGSGKTFVAKQLTDGKIRPKIVATDKWFRLFKNEWDKIWVEETGFKQKMNLLTEARLYNYFNGMLPIMIDSTSSNAESVLRRRNLLESLGYETSMVFVNTSLETSLERARERASQTGRKVPDDLIKKFRDKILELKPVYKTRFRTFIEVNNDKGELNDDSLKKAYKKARKFFHSPVKNPTGVDTIDEMQKNSWTHLVPNIYTEGYLKSFTSLWHKE